MDRYFLYIGNNENYFIEIYDIEENIQYHLYGSKVSKQLLLKHFYKPLLFNCIPITDKKFDDIINSKIVIKNITKDSLLKMLDLHEWII